MAKETVPESSAEVAVVTLMIARNGKKDLSGFETPGMSRALANAMAAEDC
jgi:hypothetical protein